MNIKTLSYQLFRRLFIAFWGNKNFYSIDLYGDELAQPIENFKGISSACKKEGLLKAHVENGDCQRRKNSSRGIRTDEVQHGIAAVSDESVIRFLADNKIRLKTCQQVIFYLEGLQICLCIRLKLYRSGVDVTINSDDD